ncbi:MAG TPA: hypothetical protein VGK83_03540 [Acidimicrobiia bacterium]
MEARNLDRDRNTAATAVPLVVAVGFLCAVPGLRAARVCHGGAYFLVRTAVWPATLARRPDRVAAG